MELTKRVAAVKERFEGISQWEERYKELIKLGKSLEEYPETDQIDKFKVKGCQSQVWLKPRFEAGHVFFKADSDAVLVRGIIGLLIQVYSGSTPDEILGYQDDFLGEIGITEHLSMNRTNGLASMLKQIKMYAVVFKSLADKGVMNADNF